MKRVLVTGAGSYIGETVRQYLEQWPEKYSVTTVGTKKGEWKEISFHSFDAVYHVAGLAHADLGRISKKKINQYYTVNTELAIKVAEKAKEEGAGQFIFMSSAIVYGDSAPIGMDKVITAQTPCSPSNYYGDSKVQAEKGLMDLSDSTFRVVLLRCPMIYGKNAKGNFRFLKILGRKLPVFPKVENARSMLYEKNLAEFVRLMIENKEAGIFWPCNREWSNTSELVKMIAEFNGKRILLLPGFSGLLKRLGHMTGYIDKAFGNLAYEKGLGDYKEEYRLYSLRESIAEIEGTNGNAER